MTVNWFQLAVEQARDVWRTAQENVRVRQAEREASQQPPKDVVQAICDGAWKGEA